MDLSEKNCRLWQMLQPERLIEIVDIGANPIDGVPPYAALLEHRLCRVTGFEPQADALQRLKERQGSNECYLPYAVGDGNRHTLKVCRASGMTSLLEPDVANLALFDFLRPLGEVIERIPVDTSRLDDIAEITSVDFLKIDVQGGELAVFQHGRSRLRGAVAIQVEVSFVTLYVDQPPFGEIDIELRRQGFIPHCFAAVKPWPLHPCVINGDPTAALNQLLEADIVYVRNHACLDRLTTEQLKHMALIAHHCYGSYDLALRCISGLEERGTLNAGASESYMNLLS